MGQCFPSANEKAQKLAKIQEDRHNAAIEEAKQLEAKYAKQLRALGVGKLECKQRIADIIRRQEDKKGEPDEVLRGEKHIWIAKDLLLDDEIAALNEKARGAALQTNMVTNAQFRREAHSQHARLAQSLKLIGLDADSVDEEVEVVGEANAGLSAFVSASSISDGVTSTDEQEAFSLRIATRMAELEQRRSDESIKQAPSPPIKKLLQPNALGTVYGVVVQ
jgi:hypothetical protein